VNAKIYKLLKTRMIVCLLLLSVVATVQPANATLRQPLRGAALSNGLTPEQHLRAMAFYSLKSQLLEKSTTNAAEAMQYVDTINKTVHALTTGAGLLDNGLDLLNVEKFKRISMASNIIINGISSSRLKIYLLKRNLKDSVGPILTITGMLLNEVLVEIPGINDDSLFKEYTTALAADNVENVATAFNNLLEHPDPIVKGQVLGVVNFAIEILPYMEYAPEIYQATKAVFTAKNLAGFQDSLFKAIEKAPFSKLSLVTQAINFSIDLASAQVYAEISIGLQTKLLAFEFLDYYLVTYGGDLAAFKADVGADAATSIEQVFEKFMTQTDALGQVMNDKYGNVNWLDAFMKVSDQANTPAAIALIRKIISEAGYLAFRISYQGGPGLSNIEVGDTTTYSFTPDPLLQMDYDFDAAAVVYHLPNGSQVNYTFQNTGKMIAPVTALPGNHSFDITYGLIEKVSKASSAFEFNFFDTIYVPSTSLTFKPISIAPTVLPDMDKYKISLALSLPSNAISYSRNASATNAAVTGTLTLNSDTVMHVRLYDYNSGLYSDWVDISSGNATVTMPILTTDALLVKSGVLSKYRIELELTHPLVNGNASTSQYATINYSDLLTPITAPYLEIQSSKEVRALSLGANMLSLTPTDVVRLYPHNITDWPDFKALTGVISVWLTDLKDNVYQVTGALLADGGIEFKITGTISTNTYYKVLAISSLDGIIKHLVPGFAAQQLVEFDTNTTTPTIPPVSTSRVAQWGDRILGFGTLTDIKSIAAGWHHSLALKYDGTVVAWGKNTSGQSTVPAGLSGVKAISGGELHSLALKSDGTVVAWGDNTFGQADVPAGLNGVKAISAGRNHSLALKNDGTVVRWGLTLGATQDTVTNGLSGVTAISAGNGHCLALKNDGTVVAWGNNQARQSDVPAGLSGIIAIFAAYDNSLALKNDGTVVAWGAWGNPITYGGATTSIASGKFFDLALKNDSTVVLLKSDGKLTVPAWLTGVSAIAAGQSHVLALKNDGTVVAWGDNTFGQSIFTGVLNNITAIASSRSEPGSSHSLALKNDGTVVAWGDNTFGQADVPAGLNGVKAISAGGYHSLALKNDGTVLAWGENTVGQSTVPVGLNEITAIAAGGAHSLALKNDGTVVAWGWGSNSAGQSTIPIGLSGVTAIAASHSSLALKNDGNVIAWGILASYYPPAVGLSGVTAIAAGTELLALKNDGTIVQGGNSGFRAAGLNQVTAIAAGYGHSLALKNDGTVTAWWSGVNYDYNQFKVPSGLNGVTSIAAGVSDSLVLADTIPDSIEFLWPRVTSLSENLPDGSYQVGSTTRTWRFKSDANAINGLKAVLVSADSGLGITMSEIVIGDVASNSEFLVNLPINPAHDAVNLKSSYWKFVDGTGADVPITNLKTGQFWLKIKTNRTPTFSQLQLDSVAGQTNTLISLPIIASDPDSDTLSYSVVSGGGSVVSGTWQGKPAMLYQNTFTSTGVYPITLQIDDGHGDTASRVIYAVIAPDGRTHNFYTDVIYPGTSTGATYDQYAAIHYLTLNGITIGTADGTNRKFEPQRIAKQAEALAMVMKAATLRTGLLLDAEPRLLENLVITDAANAVFENYTWAAPYVLKAEALGLIPSADTFNPSAPTTRAWLATIVSRLMKLNPPVDLLNPSAYLFADVSSFASTDDYDNARAAAFFGYMGLLGDTAIYNPKDTMARADVAVVTSKILRTPSADKVTTTGLTEQTLFGKPLPAITHGQSFTVTGITNLQAHRMLTADAEVYEDWMNNAADYTTATIIRPGTTPAVQGEKLVKNLAGAPVTVATNPPDISFTEERSLLVLLEARDANDKNPVRSLIRLDYGVVFPDADGDGVRDDLDKWSNNPLFSADANNNGIPDNADALWNLSARKGSDTVIINSQSMTLINAVLNNLLAGDSVTGIPMPLKTGWNLIGWTTTQGYYQGTTAPLSTEHASSATMSSMAMSDMFGTLGLPSTELFVVVGPDGVVYIPGSPFNTLKKALPGKAYWIYTPSDKTITVPGSTLLPTDQLPLSSGWNQIAYWGTEGVAPATGFNCIDGKYDILVDEVGKVYMKGSPFNTLKTLQKNKGYFIYTTAPATLVYQCP
jgi:alpha-tubulin suppressor-like RCC1 family protein